MGLQPNAYTWRDFVRYVTLTVRVFFILSAQLDSYPEINDVHCLRWLSHNDCLSFPPLWSQPQYSRGDSIAFLSHHIINSEICWFWPFSVRYFQQNLIPWKHQWQYRFWWKVEIYIFSSTVYTSTIVLEATCSIQFISGIVPALHSFCMWTRNQFSSIKKSLLTWENIAILGASVDIIPSRIIP